MRRLLLVVACLVVVFAAGCGASANRPQYPNVSGTLRSAYGGAYPIGSVAVISIVVPQGSSMAPIAEATEGVEPGWEVAGMNREIDFTVPYDPGRIEQVRSYSVIAKVLGPDGDVIAVSEGPAQVITQGSPTEGVTLTLASPSDVASSAPDATRTP